MKILLIIGAVVVSGLAIYAVYMGVFVSITIREQRIGPYHFIYKEMHGTDAREVGKITTELRLLLTNNGFTNIAPLDIYFPDQKPNHIGFMADDARVEAIITTDSLLKYRNIPEQRCMTTGFPYRNPMSYLVGYIKVDAALSKYRETHGYKKTEAGTIHQDENILYFQPIIP
ncbi:MAG TPA: hypothetical protein PLH27_00790 [bacterium]|nr:hypothetical protein [bacterium]HMW32726.1 hypothetical protein [bacterium]HMW35440.1 hypothetical protein [bacterium]HMY34557.1 hypothetical protein [bacterium]HMZ03314.1 hypothetical protein [bacterium]